MKNLLFAKKIHLAQLNYYKTMINLQFVNICTANEFSDISDLSLNLERVLH